MNTTNDTRPAMGPVNWQDAFDAEFRRTQRLTAALAAERAALELCRASRIALMELIECDRAKVAELVAACDALRMFLLDHIPLKDVPDEIYEPFCAALARAKEASK